ncbi:MAG: hypothetical protein WCX71_01565 [Candidatus Buchananbacteria bacterium]
MNNDFLVSLVIVAAIALFSLVAFGRLINFLIKRHRVNMKLAQLIKREYYRAMSKYLKDIGVARIESTNAGLTNYINLANVQFSDRCLAPAMITLLHGLLKTDPGFYAQAVQLLAESMVQTMSYRRQEWFLCRFAKHPDIQVHLMYALIQVRQPPCFEQQT